MMGHCHVVVFQRRSISSRGSVDDFGAANVHVQSAAGYVDAQFRRGTLYYDTRRRGGQNFDEGVQW
jgi:hypothetical protein